MRAADIIGYTVVSVGPDASVKEIAALLFEKRISAVPVLDEGRLDRTWISEGDLLRRKGDRHQSRRASRILVAADVRRGDPAPAEYVKSARAPCTGTS